MSMDIKNNVIDILMVNNKGFIWNTDDWYILRSKYRILGSLIGTLPFATHQQYQNGLPCYLLPEEVRLLIENNIGRVVEYPSFTSLPNKHSTFLKNKKDEEDLQERKKEFAQQKADDIHKLVINAILADGDNNCKEVIELNKEISKIKPLHVSSYVQIHLDETCSDAIEIPLPELIMDLKRLRYNVFKDLWSKGFYLTCGMKFGGDFLVYKSDPISCHATYIVFCRDMDEHIILSLSRVSSITNKKIVFAKESEDSIQYLMYRFNNSSHDIPKKPINFIF